MLYTSFTIHLCCLPLPLPLFTFLLSQLSLSLFRKESKEKSGNNLGKIWGKSGSNLGKIWEKSDSGRKHSQKNLMLKNHLRLRIGMTMEEKIINLRPGENSCVFTFISQAMKYSVVSSTSVRFFHVFFLQFQIIFLIFSICV